jgi:hypothetical protein
MPDVNIKCGNPACPGPSNTVATYRHACGVAPTTWTAPAVGPKPDSAPQPTPCPNDGTPCPPFSIKCTTCKWARQYPV